MELPVVITMLKYFSLTTLLLTLLPIMSSQAETALADNLSVLMPFKARYTTEWKVGWFSIDVDATRELKQLDQQHWQLTFEAETSAAKLRESSRFTLTPEQRIQPLHYTYRASGLFNEDDRTLQFLPDTHSIRDQEKNKTYPQAWQDEIHDNLTYMLQAGLDLATGQQQFSYPVFEKNRNKPFRFEVIGEETLNTRAGKLETVKVRQIRKKKDREIIAWFAKDKHYLLVRLRDKKDGKKRYEINIRDIQM